MMLTFHANAEDFGRMLTKLETFHLSTEALLKYDLKFDVVAMQC
jgi:hypothetical protein